MVKYFVCHNNIDINIMRVHVGKHILKKDVTGVNVCGFCGQSSCSNNLKRSSVKKNQTFFKVQSNCAYFIEWKKTPSKFLFETYAQII